MPLVRNWEKFALQYRHPAYPATSALFLIYLQNLKSAATVKGTKGSAVSDTVYAGGEFIYLTVETISYHDPHNQGESIATGCQIKTELSHQEVLGSRLSYIGAPSKYTQVSEAGKAAKQPRLRSSRVGEADERCEAPQWSSRSMHCTPPEGSLC
jgi:hypothetical protein